MSSSTKLSLQQVKYMSTQENNAPFPLESEVHNCPQCNSQMLREMRFCRSCGFRLGEGVAEYTETRRFDAPPVSVNATTPLPLSAQTSPQGWGQIPQVRPIQPVATWQPRQPRKGMHWLVWVIVGVVASSALGGAFIGSVKGIRGVTISSKAEPPRSYLGADDLDSADNNAGVFVGKITPPGSAADKAGLVGGDIITTFDGQTVTSRDQLVKILTKTPIGKTVDVAFLRDGQTIVTKLTTVSEAENDKLDEAFDNVEHGFLGVDDLDRVTVPGMNISGVRVGNVVDNRPAYIQGMKDGDIIVEFNGAPIRTTRELEMRIDRAPPLSVAKIVVMRGGENTPVEKILFEIKVGKD